MINAEPAITFDEVSKQYKGGNLALSQLSCDFSPGKVTALLGPNGAGKSTAIKSIVGLTDISSGRVSVCGLEVNEKNKSLRERVGYVGQTVSLDIFSTVTENLLFHAAMYKVDRSNALGRIEELINIFDMSSFANRKVRTFSGGEKRRLDIAMALIHKPDLLILDEPTVGLDVDSQCQIWAYLEKLQEEEEITIVFSTHNLYEAERYADNIIFINIGKVVAKGTPDELTSLVGGETVKVSFDSTANALKASLALDSQESLNTVSVKDDSVFIVVDDGAKSVAKIVSLLNEAQLEATNIQVKKPSLDDVYMKITGEQYDEVNMSGQETKQSNPWEAY